MNYDYDNLHKIGDIGEAYEQASFVEAGCNVSKPLSDNNPYDFIADWKGKLFKIQVKTTQQVKDDGRMYFNITRSRPDNTYVNYREDEVDYFFLYCIKERWRGLISKQDAAGKEVCISFVPPINNCYYKYKIAEDYEFDKAFEKYFIDNENQEELKLQKLDELIYVINPNFPDCIEHNGLRIPRDLIKYQVRTMHFSEVSKLYDVTDNAIRKWLVKLGLPRNKGEIDAYDIKDWMQI